GARHLTRCSACASLIDCACSSRSSRASSRSFLPHPSGPPPDLHSLPTRRSSDLIYKRIAPEIAHDALHAQVDDAAGARLNQLFEDRKSTSELQSRENLVCRLLLEKKKGIGAPADGELGQPGRVELPRSQLVARLG